MQKRTIFIVIVIAVTIAALYLYADITTFFAPIDAALRNLIGAPVASQPDWAPLAELGVIGLIGVAVAFLLPRISLRAVFLSIAIGLCLLMGGAILLAQNGIGVNIGLPLMLLIGGALCSMPFRSEGMSEQYEEPEEAEETGQALHADGQDAAQASSGELYTAGPGADSVSSQPEEPVHAELISRAEHAAEPTGVQSIGVVDATGIQQEGAPAALPEPVEALPAETFGASEPHGMASLSSHEEVQGAEQTAHTVEPEKAQDVPLPDGEAVIVPHQEPALLAEGPHQTPFGTEHAERDDYGRNLTVYTFSSELSSKEGFNARSLLVVDLLRRTINTRIAKFVATNQEGSFRSYSFETVTGEPLSAVCRKRSRLPLVEVCWTIGQIAEVLDRAHKNGLFHRALRPEVIFRTPRSDIRITEFGLAELADFPPEAIPSELLPYTAPEILSQAHPDGRTDLFSLGVIFFEMLTGERPFAGATAQELTENILLAPAPVARAIVPELPIYCDLILERLLAKRREDRYQLSIDVVDDMSMLLANL
ncbi:MAG TPA: serine/threonine-protein kinase [Dissulfurispiraceae bacterium]|nr:serine/threonine-protein kinase [Dissulfurispiraceae bacterium]